jgi:ribosomal protein L24E
MKQNGSEIFFASRKKCFSMFRIDAKCRNLKQNENEMKRKQNEKEVKTALIFAMKRN